MGGLFFKVLRFELHYHARQPLIYIVCGLFFLLAFAGTASENVTIGGGTQNLNLNAPFVVIQTLCIFSIIGMFAAVAFAANPVLRDFENRTAEIFYTTRVDRFSYLIGRFAAAFLFCYLTMLAATLGVLVGEMMPWLDPERIAPTAWTAYLFVHAAIVLPNCFILAAGFFCAATLMRSMFGAYLVSAAVMILFSVISNFTDPDVIRRAAIAEPFGLIAYLQDTRYWTVFDRNNRVPGLTGELLLNRGVWLALALGALAIAYRMFSFEVGPRGKRRDAAVEVPGEAPAHTGKGVASVRFDGAGRLQQLLSQAALELRVTLRSVPFIVLVLFGVLNLTLGSIGIIAEAFGTPVYPVTRLMMNNIRGGYLFMVFLVIIYYSAELVNRDRALGVHSLIDPLPWPNWVMVAAKLVALLSVVLIMLLVGILTAMAIQAFHGYFDFQPLVYLFGIVVVHGVPFYLAAVLAVTVQALVQNKYVGMLIMTIYVISVIALPGAGFPHQLYRYTVDDSPYSDINGFGHYLIPWFWFSFYWFLFAILLVLLAHLTWTRGEIQGLRQRWRLARERFTRPVQVTAACAFVAFAVVGSYIYYNTNVLNVYRTRDDVEQRQAEYEKRFKQYQYLPQPWETDVTAEVDIYPAQRDVYARGTYRIENRLDRPASELHITIPRDIEVRRLEIDRAALAQNDESFGYRIYRFSPALEPGEAVELRFETAWINDGFVNDDSNHRVVYNGSFFNNTEIFPQLGYQGTYELTDNNRRRKFGLPPVKRAPGIDDEAGRQRAYMGDWHRVNFATTVSTSQDQIAVAPGYLDREWTKGERRYFHYRMDQPIWNFFAYLSQDYRVAREKWSRGDEQVNLEVFYHHDFNIDSMMQSARDSLDYFSTEFSPYQYRQFRILEFPAYERFAQSFPNTVPFSEAIGFVADLRDPESIDYVYYVTAHEFAHQWWGHQVISADTQGAAFLVETLAQYSALMVMERKFGRNQMQRFLRYELDRYLSDRGGELIEELPLELVENQGYIHYRKGSVAMYALKEAIGEEKINRALRRLIEGYAFKGAPYPTAKTLIGYFRKEAGPQYDGLITDLFEKIVLFDLKAEDVALTELPDGRFQVDLTVAAHKFEAAGSGEEHEVPIDDTFDIAVLGEKTGEHKLPEVLHMEQVHLDAPRQTFRFVVDKRPVSAGIDPWFKRIDRIPTDNVKTI